MSAGTDSCRSGVPETDFSRYMVGETDNRRYMVSCCIGRYTVREANVGRCTVRGACLAVRGACLESGDGFPLLWGARDRVRTLYGGGKLVTDVIW